MWYPSHSSICHISKTIVDLWKHSKPPSRNEFVFLSSLSLFLFKVDGKLRATYDHGQKCWPKTTNTDNNWKLIVPGHKKILHLVSPNERTDLQIKDTRYVSNRSGPGDPNSGTWFQSRTLENPAYVLLHTLSVPFCLQLFCVRCSCSFARHKYDEYRKFDASAPTSGLVCGFSLFTHKTKPTIVSFLARSCSAWTMSTLWWQYSSTYVFLW